MKNIKKLGKRMLCSMIALVCMLSASLPVYAGGGGTVRGDEVLVLSYYDYKIGDKGNVDKTFFRELYAVGGGNMYPLVVVDSNFSKGGLIVGICDTSVGQYGVKNYTTNLNSQVVTDGTTPSGSSISALAFFKKMSGVYDGKDCTWYQYLINSGISKDDIEKYLSEVNMCLGYSIGMRDWNDTNREITVATSKFNVMELYYYIVSLYQKEKPWEKEDIDTAYLPMLDYKISKKFGLQPANDFIKYNIHVNWDHTKKLPYSEELSRYNVEVCAVLNLEDLGNSSKCKRVTLENTTSDHLSFGSDDVAELLGSSPADNLSFTGYIYNICIRTCDKNSSKVSYWKTWVVTSTGAGKNPDITPGTKYYDKAGNVVKGSDGNDLDRTPSDDNIDNSGYVKDPDGTSNTAKKDPSSDLYEDADGKVSATGTLSSIKQIILSLGDVPKLLALCLTWLPSSFTTLIGAALSMIVIIGVIRWLK